MVSFLYAANVRGARRTTTGSQFRPRTPSEVVGSRSLRTASRIGCILLFSLDGVRCYDCPSGAKCTIAVRRATETIASDYGSSSPRTKEGYYLFEAPASKHAKQCSPSDWKSGDPCKAVAERSTADENVTNVINSCSNLNGFKDYWTADRTFSCLAGLSFYSCEVSGSETGLKRDGVMNLKAP